MNCSRCGATIDPLALACPFCKLTTPAGVMAEERRREEARVRAGYEAHASVHRQHAEHRRLMGTANQALVFSLLGIVLCCLPTGIVGIVQGARARAMAKAANVPPPGRATVGLVLGIVSIVSSIGFIVFIELGVQEDKKVANARIDAIEASVGARAANAALERDVACGLAEQYVLRNGFGGNRGYSIAGFDCPGRVRVTSGEAAELDTFRFTHGSSDKFETVACFKRGAKWFVADVVDAKGPNARRCPR